MNKYLFLLVCIFACFISCQNQELNGTTGNNQNALVASQPQNITYQIIAGSNNTFGYDISIEGKKHIHQPFIPGLAGSLGFKSAEKAEKVALFLIEKIKKGEKLPNISSEELHQLGAL